ncbi:hypothetical protein HO173_012858 [Letharia columbiana]|uniref:Uncharacterized protein n=1 Tax=Letharia columbiana TaxID=112416 RepID=A0A8H6FEN6_9LECA|nr:uncharacterized protein HO173_012858 [Letharia columbiana]KAF6225291.1 hypothetical protein HO173_012858 [Letharia columbiana]
MRSLQAQRAIGHRRAPLHSLHRLSYGNNAPGTSGHPILRTASNAKSILEKRQAAEMRETEEEGRMMKRSMRRKTSELLRQGLLGVAECGARSVLKYRQHQSNGLWELSWGRSR